MTDNNNLRAWSVDAPLTVVFKKYRDYAKTAFSNTLIFGGGIRVDGDYFGDTAELSVTQLDGFPILKRSFSLYFELKKSKKNTIVNAWAKDEGWEERAKKFKRLFPKK